MAYVRLKSKEKVMVDEGGRYMAHLYRDILHVDDFPNKFIAHIKYYYYKPDGTEVVLTQYSSLVPIMKEDAQAIFSQVKNTSTDITDRNGSEYLGAFLYMISQELKDEDGNPDSEGRGYYNLKPSDYEILIPEQNE